MCEICARTNVVQGEQIWVRFYGGCVDGAIAIVRRSNTEVRAPDLGGGHCVYTWAKGPKGTAYEQADVLVCTGAVRIDG